MAWKQIKARGRGRGRWPQVHYTKDRSTISIAKDSFGEPDVWEGMVTMKRSQFRDLVKEVMPELFEEEKT